MDADLAEWPLAYILYFAALLVAWGVGLVPAALIARLRRHHDISRAAHRPC